MPNNVMNRVKIIGHEKRIDEIFEAIKQDEHGLGSIDFEKIIPMPPGIFRGDLGPDEQKEYGENNWYDWSLSNWNTKWNSYGYGDLPPAEDDEIVFETAWEPPKPVIYALSKMYPDVQFGHAWADEELGFNVGEITYGDGEELSHDVPIGGSKEAYEMSADILGVDLLDYNMVYNEELGNYEYLDDEQLEQIWQKMVANEEESEEFGGMNLS